MRRRGTDCSVEAGVMLVERRGRVIAIGSGQPLSDNRHREEPEVQWKAAAFARWHEPDDARLGVKFPGPTRHERRFRDLRGTSAYPPRLSVKADIPDRQVRANSGREKIDDVENS
jgi:hypothetical protein